MDIAKYIGLYLLKNNFCYIHGLGNLELKKKPASYDGQALNAPSFEVTVSPTGSIDDGLANFIATNEQISISKAANALREFSTKSKVDLQKGEDVIIPSIGKFVWQNGRIGFVTDPHLKYTPPAIPTIKSAPHIVEEKKAEAKPIYTPPTPVSKPKVNWSKIILAAAVLGLIVGIVGYGAYYINNRAEEVKEESPLPVDTTTTMPVPATVDSTIVVDTAAQSNVQMQNGMLSFKVILRTYKDSVSANKQVKKYTSYGMTTEAVMKDSAYHVVMPVTAPPTDTARIIDSLRRTYNPKGVSILQ
jgi:nucleoid DNA-binding protein